MSLSICASAAWGQVVHELVGPMQEHNVLASYSAVDVLVDGSTATTKLEKLPDALYEGAMQALRDKGLHIGVLAANEEKGQRADLVDTTDHAGIRFELVLNAALHDPDDLLRWKRIRTTANMGMMRCLEQLDIKRGRLPGRG